MEIINKNWVKRFLLHLIWKISPRLFKKRFIYLGQIFSIGIYSGESPFSVCCIDDNLSPVITAADIKDIPAAFVADPFMIQRDGTWYMFFEAYNQIKGRGEIGVAISYDAETWSYQKIVLKAPFHLSYPHVFQWNNQFFMIPESSHQGVVLYQARKFPYRWERLKTLIDVEGLVDSSIFYSDNTWWLFTSQDGNDPDDQGLRLYFAAEPTGNWDEHPQSPINKGRSNLTRCAGRVIRYKKRLIRFAQNGLPEYGTDVRAFDVAKLNRREYQEKEISTNPVLCGSNQSWNRGGMHHIDAHCIGDGKWLACVDGWYSNRRW